MTQCDSCERMAKAETSIQNLEVDVGVLSKKIDKLLYWILGIMGTSVLTLVAIIAKG